MSVSLVPQSCAGAHTGPQYSPRNTSSSQLRWDGRPGGGRQGYARTAKATALPLFLFVGVFFSMSILFCTDLCLQSLDFFLSGKFFFFFLAAVSAQYVSAS